jgi:hypothetical protein
MGEHWQHLLCGFNQRLGAIAPTAQRVVDVMKNHGKSSGKSEEIDGGRLVPALMGKNAGKAFSLFHESVEWADRSDCVDIDTN